MILPVHPLSAAPSDILSNTNRWTGFAMRMVKAAPRPVIGTAAGGGGGENLAAQLSCASRAVSAACPIGAAQ